MNTPVDDSISFFGSIPEDKKRYALIRGAIAAAIINKRHSLGLTQKAFARQYGISQGMVSKWESAEYNFTIEKLNQLMLLLDIPFDMILNGESATGQDFLSTQNLPELSNWTINNNIVPIGDYSIMKGVAS